jgi:hypothetical protein
MTKKKDLNTLPIHSASLVKRMLQGAAIALILIALFLFSADNPDPNWPRFWMIKPLVIVPLAGAMGGLFYYWMDNLRYHGGWKNILAMAVSLIGYLFVLWIGTVLGLDGTYWD